MKTKKSINRTQKPFVTETQKVFALAMLIVAISMGPVMAQTTTVSKIKFTGVGGNSGVAADYYGIYQESGAWTYPYPDLRIQYRTGIKYDAYWGFGGHQFYTGYDVTGNPAGLQMQITDKVYIAGNVGIGTNAPIDKLAVNGTVGMLGTGTGTYNRAVIYNDLTHHWLFERARTTDSPTGEITDFIISQRGGGTPGLIVKGSGNVGIGTSTPTYKLHALGDIYANGGWLRVSGNAGLYFESYGGGFYMSDNTWIRTYNNKNFYHNTGIMRTDGEFNVGPSGNRFIVKAGGNVGIGTTNPAFRLDLGGGVGSTSGYDQLLTRNIELFTSYSPGQGEGIITLHHGGRVAHQLRYNNGSLYLEESRRPLYGTSNDPKLIVQGSVGVGSLSPDFVQNKFVVHDDAPNGGNQVFMVKRNVGSPDYASVVMGVGGASSPSVKIFGGLCVVPNALDQCPDYVFEEDYQLKSLDDLENFVKTNKHLPNVPNADEIKEKGGVDMIKLNYALLEKVEELTLYTIEQDKQIKQLRAEQQKQIDQLRNELLQALNAQK